MEDDGSSAVHITCVGGYSGVVTVQSLECTLGEFRRLLIERIGRENIGEPKLISAGRTLKDDCMPLSAVGVSGTSKILVLAGSDAVQSRAVSSQAEQAARLDRLKAAVDAMASRDHPTDNAASFVIENQAGQSLQLTEGDRKAVGMGLAMHSRGQISLKQGEISEALQQLLVAEEAFELVSPNLTDGIDNIALLKLDIVWCFFQLQDSSKLAAASERLAAARKALRASHGPDLARLRVLHGEFRPELALYVRLELLEGIAAFLSGQKEAARRLLQAAKAKWQQLQVSDDSLAALVGLGFNPQEAKRALRFCADNLDQAADFALQQRKHAEERRAKEREERRLRREQRGYGFTHSGQPVNMEVLGQLQGMLDFDRPLIAEALRQVDNSGDSALDLLTDADARLALLQSLSAAEGSRGRKRDREDGQQRKDSFGAEAAEEGSSAEEANPGAAVADPEAEATIAEGVSDDPLAAYDVDVHEEGVVIEEYLKQLQ